MILNLFVVFAILAIVMISIGLSRPTESAQALIGFFLLFVLGIIITSGNLEYETGSQVNTTYFYDSDGSVNGTVQTISNTYTAYQDTPGQQTAHWIGYYLTLAAGIGFAGVIWSLRRIKKPD